MVPKNATNKMRNAMFLSYCTLTNHIEKKTVLHGVLDKSILA